MKKIILLVLSICLFLNGCSEVRSSVSDSSEEIAGNSESARAAEEILKNPVKLSIAAVCAVHVDCDRGVAALKTAMAYIETRADVKFTDFKTLYAPEPVQGTIIERWSQLAKKAQELGATESDITIILLEDYPDTVNAFNFDEEKMLGLASGIGVAGLQPSGAFIKVEGGPVFLSRIIIHELGHLLGAEHTDDGIMQPYANANQYCDEYSLFSLGQIQEHLKQVKIYRAIEAASAVEAEEANRPDEQLIYNL